VAKPGLCEWWRATVASAAPGGRLASRLGVLGGLASVVTIEVVGGEAAGDGRGWWGGVRMEPKEAYTMEEAEEEAPKEGEGTTPSPYHVKKHAPPMKELSHLPLPRALSKPQTPPSENGCRCKECISPHTMTLSSSSGQCEIRTCKAMSEISVRCAKRGVPVAGNMQLLVVRRRGRAGSSAALCGPEYPGLEVELLDAMTDELLECNTLIFIRI
jgi:hypothetical protein